MSQQNLVNSTQPPEQVVSQLITQEKRQELMDRLSQLKATLNMMEGKVAEQKETIKAKEESAVLELDRRMQILQDIGSQIRANIQAVAQIQVGEKYHPSLPGMVKNLEKINGAYSLILDGLTS
jgi:hypothetical protein